MSFSVESKYIMAEVKDEIAISIPASIKEKADAFDRIAKLVDEFAKDSEGGDIRWLVYSCPSDSCRFINDVAKLVAITKGVPQVLTNY
jgi:hypothetical protein